MKVLLPLALFISSFAFAQVGYMDGAGAYRPFQNTFWPAATRLHLQTKDEGLSFNVAFADVDQATGIGFDHPEQGAARRQTLTDVLAYLDSILADNGTLDIEVQTSQTDASGPLANATSLFFTEDGIIRGFPYRHITTLVDPCRADNCGEDMPDMLITVDFGYALTTGNPNGSQYDLFSVLLHEMVHGLGMFATTTQTGESMFGTAVSYYQSLLATGTGQTLWNQDGTLAASAAALTGSDSGVVFQGQAARAALGETPVVHTPQPYVAGESLVHWSQTTGTAPVMRSQILTGETKRTFEDFERGLLADLGYSVTGSGVQLFFPWISNSTDFESTMVLTNYGDTAATAGLTARRADGAIETETITIPARGFTAVKAEDLFTSLGVGPGYSVLLQADVQHLRARWVTNDRVTLAPSQGIAVRADSPGDMAGSTIEFGYLPGRDGLISAPVLANLSAETQTVNLYLYNADGALQRSQTLTLDPYVPSVPHFQGDDEIGDVYAIAHSETANLTGVVFVFNNQGQTAIGNVTSIDNFTPPAN